MFVWDSSGISCLAATTNDPSFLTASLPICILDKHRARPVTFKVCKRTQAADIYNSNDAFFIVQSMANFIMTDDRWRWLRRHAPIVRE
jgi:hypothetical protein